MLHSKELQAVLEGFQLNNPDATWEDLKEALRDVAEGLLSRSVPSQHLNGHYDLLEDHLNTLAEITATMPLTVNQAKTLIAAKEIFKAAQRKLQGHPERLAEIVEGLNEGSDVLQLSSLSSSVRASASVPQVKRRPAVSFRSLSESYMAEHSVNIKPTTLVQQTSKPVITTLVPLMAAALENWIEHQVTKVRRKHVGLQFFQMVKAENAAAITVKIVLNTVAKKGPQSVQSLAVSLGRGLEEEARFGRIREQEAEHFQKHIHKALNTRNGHTYKVAFMEKVEAHMLEANELESAWTSWNSVENDVAYHIGIRLLEVLIESTQLVEMKRENAGNIKLDGEFIYLTQAWADKLCERAFSLAGVTPRHQGVRLHRSGTRRHHSACYRLG
ncbi:hypothetical protein I5L59_04930 [Pseudomonas moraviensis]|uniref:hypothetical protein n=1 Tax=Pseudomonas moraviensis TaxID=321662 RepID=UPI0018D9EB6B|nr:hypothetical protein [Pseudomonas moraviensis]MBH3442914.1 hypothetical protein [Pseudomonas moraviensis]